MASCEGFHPGLLCSRDVACGVVHFGELLELSHGFTIASIARSHLLLRSHSLLQRMLVVTQAQVLALLSWCGVRLC